MSSPPSAPGRAAAIGLAAGMLIGAIALAGRAIVLSGSECAPGLTGEDCAFEVTLATETARFYLYFAAGLLLMGVGLFVLFRKKKEPLP